MGLCQFVPGTLRNILGLGHSPIPWAAFKENGPKNSKLGRFWDNGHGLFQYIATLHRGFGPGTIASARGKGNTVLFIQTAAKTKHNYSRYILAFCVFISHILDPL